MPCPKLESAFDYKGQIVGTIVGGFLAFRGGVSIPATTSERILGHLGKQF